MTKAETDKLNAVQEGVTDAWSDWIQRRQMDLAEIVGESVTASWNRWLTCVGDSELAETIETVVRGTFREWLDEHTDELVDAISKQAAGNGPKDLGTDLSDSDLCDPLAAWLAGRFCYWSPPGNHPRGWYRLEGERWYECKTTAVIGQATLWVQEQRDIALERVGKLPGIKDFQAVRKAWKHYESLAGVRDIVSLARGPLECVDPAGPGKGDG